MARAKTWHRQAKARGREFEQAVCDFLRTHGLPAERRRLSGELDLGDVAGWDRVIVECKNTKAITLPEFTAEAEREAGNAHERWGRSHLPLVVIRRRGQVEAGESFAVLPLRVMVEVIEAWRAANP